MNIQELRLVNLSKRLYMNKFVRVFLFYYSQSAWIAGSIKHRKRANNLYMAPQAKGADSTEPEALKETACTKCTENKKVIIIVKLDHAAQRRWLFPTLKYMKDERS